MRSRRGFSSWAALSAVLAVGVLIAAALSARTNELGFEDRTLCRVRARWAAESAIARGRAGAGNLSQERLDDSTTYRLTTRRDAGALELQATGIAEARGHACRVAITARIADGRVLSWKEEAAKD